MAFIRNTDSARTGTAGAALSIEPGNPVHMLYAGAAVLALPLLSPVSVSPLWLHLR